MDRNQLEEQLRQLPIVQYEFFPTRELVFSQKVREICRQECPMYGSSWACPPAVGTVEECRSQCLSYPDALLITTMAEVEDMENMAATLATRQGHEDITRQVHWMLLEQGADCRVLSTEACAICPRCTYPDAPCRHPERMYPCVESQGILVTALAERFAIDFQAGHNIVTWFSLLLYR